MKANFTKTRVAFFPPKNSDWLGGVNYYIRIFQALKNSNDSNIEVIIFLPKDVETSILNEYSLFVDEVYCLTSVNHKSFFGIIKRIENYLFGSSYFLELLLFPYRIDITSHAHYVKFLKIKSIIWIPDFQHIYLPEMFSDLEVKKRNQIFSHLFKYSDAILVSSQDALKSLNYFSAKYSYKANVLSFTTLPPKGYFNLNDSDRHNIFKKYSIPGPYFYLPNQFWKHKDHLTAFKAIEIAIKMGKEIFLVCSGNFNDFRNPDYFDYILKFINVNNLKKNIILLGMINHEDVYSLIKFSKAVINPSFFEGWSTTVEECKSVGKQIILSDIDVHKEQAPQAIFFKKGNPMELAKILIEFSDSTETSSHKIIEINSNKFVDNYIKLVHSISQKNRE